MKFDLIEPIQISEKTNKHNGKRRYTLPNGLAFPSVTTIIREVKGSQYNFAYIDKALLERARNIGTLVHSEIECYLEHGTELGEIAQIHQRNIIKDLEVVRGIEVACYSLNGWAGRADLIAEHKELGTCLIDWKNTGSKTKKTKSKMRNEMIQVSLYSLAMEETYGVEIDNAVLSIAHYNDAAPVDYNAIVLDKELMTELQDDFIDCLESHGIDW